MVKDKVWYIYYCNIQNGKIMTTAFQLEYVTSRQFCSFTCRSHMNVLKQQNVWRSDIGNFYFSFDRMIDTWKCSHNIVFTTLVLYEGPWSIMDTALKWLLRYNCPRLWVWHLGLVHINYIDYFISIAHL